MTKHEFLGYLHGGDFRQLFLECFWSNPPSNSSYRFQAGEETFEVREVAQKGLKVFVCNVAKIPDSSVRRLIDTKLRKLSHDYFVIFVSTSEPFHHLWSVPVKAVDKRTLVTVEYVQDDQALFLLEKMNALTFSIDENPTIIDVANRVNTAFLVNTTDVTKKFYQAFRKQHDMFVKGIENIAGKDEREWYASVMLNRLMFCYFIQKKRFLDFDENYLGNKLRETQSKKGKDRFYESFYRSFLKQLFSDGLDKPVAARSDYFLRKYGRIPYLNGGMFSMHQIEKENKDIDIPDKVFEKLFAFFDEWHWHLDNRITASGRDINPDVLGYIFEQYINDRAQMGAYYTKEDITEYIGRNCIVPWLWKKAVGDRDLNEVVDLKGSGGRYIFPAMRKGMEHELPPEIEKGVAVEPQATLRKRRAEWNKAADEKHALPTEIWRETVARRQRCEEILKKIAKGEMRDIHDFITYNLDIRTFVEDAIRSTSDHKLVLHFYKALREVTILDPTCGSGAFLFAGLNILEPLYEACLDRMEDFHAQNGNLFKDELAEITGKFRSNRQYFIYKNIILRNLYGVDIMHEATEIARLRLFLKMVAVVDVDEYDENLGLDPLPDIDFNIRCGNTLVGYATEQEIKDGLVNGDMFAYVELKAKIDAEMEKSSMAFDFFRREQLNLMGDRHELVKAKEEIHARLAEIRKLLDKHLYASAGTLKKREKWLADTQPFHWYTEFYPIMHGRGGFDVIIGNPPYLEKKQINYEPCGFVSWDTGAVHAVCMERGAALLSSEGTYGMIVPMSLPSTQRMKTVQDILENGRSVWYSNWAWRPAKLFDTVNRALTVFVAIPGEKTATFSTAYQKWTEDNREGIFEKILYVGVGRDRPACWIPKLGQEVERDILGKMFTAENREVASLLTDSGERVYYRVGGGLYWKVFTDFAPRFVLNGKEGHSSRETWLTVVNGAALPLVAVLSSDLFWWWYTITSNVRDLNPFDLHHFRVPKLILEDPSLRKLGCRYQKDIKKNSEMMTRVQKKTGETQTQSFRIKLSKPIIDEIDELLAKHYGFTEEELDFIINYDIKYRMGDELNAE